MNFKDNVAIVTGGSEGIGYGISRALASRGFKVYLVARTSEKLELAVKKIRLSGGIAEIRQGDITDYKLMTKIIDDVYIENKRLDIFVNNAGGWRQQNFGEDVESLRKMRNLTRDGPTEITEYLINKFRGESRKLKILNVVSQAGLRFLGGNLGYGIGKMNFAVNLMILQGQMDHEDIKNIDLYGLYPGTVATSGVIDSIKKGELQNATSLDSVVGCAIDLLLDKTHTRHAYIGFIPGRGIVRQCLRVDPKEFRTFPVESEEIINADFNPKSLID